MKIDWPKVRQLMLTSNEVLPPSRWGRESSRLDAILFPEQLDVAERCIRALYQGLQWANKSKTELKIVNLSKIDRHFLIEDEHVIGIFEDCFGNQNSGPVGLSLPSSLQDYIELQAEGKRFIVADLVLEKENLRLVNRWGRDHQSKFMRDLVFPGFMGILVQYCNSTEQLKRLERQYSLNHPQIEGQPSEANNSLSSSYITAAISGILTHKLLLDVVYDVKESDLFLASHPPLDLFHNANSPFNLELAQADVLSETGYYEDPVSLLALEAMGFALNGEDCSKSLL